MGHFALPCFRNCFLLFLIQVSKFYCFSYFQNVILAKLENLKPEFETLMKQLHKETAWAVHNYKWDQKFAKRMFLVSVMIY